jgi:Transcription termination factor nusG
LARLRKPRGSVGLRSDNADIGKGPTAGTSCEALGLSIATNGATIVLASAITQAWMFVMAFWAAAQLQPQRDQLALHCLKLFGFETYAPRLRDQRTIRGSKVIKTPLLFPGYAFVLIELQWSQARWSPGVVRLVMDGITPAVVTRYGGHLAPGAGSERPDRVATIAAISTRRSRARPAWSARRAGRIVRRHETARAGRGVADVAGQFAPCRIGWLGCRTGAT